MSWDWSRTFRNLDFGNLIVYVHGIREIEETMFYLQVTFRMRIHNQKWPRLYLRDALKMPWDRWSAVQIYVYRFFSIVLFSFAWQPDGKSDSWVEVKVQNLSWWVPFKEGIVCSTCCTCYTTCWQLTVTWDLNDSCQWLEIWGLRLALILTVIWD